MAELQSNTPGTIEAHALARHVRMSPQKARLVIDLIRGQKAQDALQSLRYTPKRAAKHIEKVLRSAIANAERKADDSGSPLDVDQLFVSKAYVNEGSRWKRLRPATRSAPRIFSWALRSTMSPPPNASRPMLPKPNRRKVFGAPHAVCARH
jgi:large subunit ribosomal protein L22